MENKSYDKKTNRYCFSGKMEYFNYARNRIIINYNKITVCASGIILWTFDQDKLWFYLATNRKKEIEEPGGKVDATDLSVSQTAIRETKEESENKLDINLDNAIPFYYEKGKYVAWLKRVNKEDFKSLVNVKDTDGSRERRNFDWISSSNILLGKKHPRLKGYITNIISFLNTIRKSKYLKKYLE